MEPVWKLSTFIPVDTEFDLSQSFGLGSDADAFIFSDFLGEPAYYGRRVELSGRLTLDQQVSGKLTLDQRLAGRLTTEQRLDGDV
jgi:hypothetical protein